MLSLTPNRWARQPANLAEQLRAQTPHFPTSDTTAQKVTEATRQSPSPLGSTPASHHTGPSERWSANHLPTDDGDTSCSDRSDSEHVHYDPETDWNRSFSGAGKLSRKAVASLHVKTLMEAAQQKLHPQQVKDLLEGTKSPVQQARMLRHVLKDNPHK